MRVLQNIAEIPEDCETRILPYDDRGGGEEEKHSREQIE